MYDILPMTRFVILTASMTKNIKKCIIIFLKLNETVWPTSQWRHNKGGIRHLITVIIKSTLLTAAKLVPFRS